MEFRDATAKGKGTQMRGSDAKRHQLFGLATRLGAGAFLAISVAVSGLAPAAAAGVGPSSGQLRQFAQQLNLSDSQEARVNEITQTLIDENNESFRRHGVTPGQCSDQPRLELAALNNEVDSAYQKARGQLQRVLSADQMRQFSAIYWSQRQATKAQIVCNGRAS